MDFVDRILKCSDCGNDFIFTAGEQLFFFDRQFKNDPKRCKLCKAKRAGLGRTVDGSPVAATLPLSRTETRTQCSACGVETTVPFKPTQGRPVFCRSCFQVKRVPAAVARVAGLDSPADAAMNAMDSMHSLDAHSSMSAATLESIADTPAAALNVADASTSALERMAAEAAQA
jgi:CxxC-x17-CxxC domain-containing protein